MTDRQARNRNQQAGAHLLEEFVVETGVVGGTPPRRYLWTDAFAVCTLLGLDDAGLEPELEGFDDYRALAGRLVAQVHEVLGRHRADDVRQGWISGLSEKEGEHRPTAGGLRIGKPRPERGPDEAWDDRLEWERDGQYFHYLTKWMHALRRMGATEGDPRYLTWALALAKTAHRGFVRQGAEGKRTLHWKMSIDLSRPLVATMARHDPLDGYLTYRTLVAPGAPVETGADGLLHEEIADLATLAGLHNWGRWVTDDPLGLGELLTDAYRVAQLRAHGVSEPDGLILGLLKAAHQGLESYTATRPMDRPPMSRLPFRELGLSIGLRALERLSSLVTVDGIPGASQEIERRLDALLVAGEGLAERIEDTWLEQGARDAETWQAHADINAVMLATSLAPRGYLAL